MGPLAPQCAGKGKSGNGQGYAGCAGGTGCGPAVSVLGRPLEGAFDAMAIGICTGSVGVFIRMRPSGPAFFGAGVGTEAGVAAAAYGVCPCFKTTCPSSVNVKSGTLPME